MEKNEIIKIYGTEYKDMTKTLLNEAKLSERINHGMRIAIKPNLVCPVPADFGATTHPDIVAGIIEYLRENGFEDIVIIEGSWVGDTTEDSFEYCGFNDLSKKYGIRLIDTQKEKSHKVNCDGEELSICDCMDDIDFLINVPVLKGHCQAKITCALKNMKGLIPNSEKRRFHSMGLHNPIAHLNTGIKQDFIVVDHICGDLDFEDGGNPIVRNCIMAAVDPVLTDAYVCKLLGYSIDDVPYVKLAGELGIGNSNIEDLKVITIGEDLYGEDLPTTHKMLEVSYVTEDADSCSACYASLSGALARLNDEGLLENFDSKISIGQGHRGKSGEYGIGNCTKEFIHNVPGCPPEEDEVYEAIKGWILKK